MQKLEQELAKAKAELIKAVKAAAVARKMGIAGPHIKARVQRAEKACDAALSALEAQRVITMRLDREFKLALRQRAA